MEEIENQPISNLKPIFSELIKLTLSTSSFQDKYIIKLDPELISILNKIIHSNPEYFNNLEISFNQIIADQKIDFNDIPIIIILLSDLYKILYDHKINEIVKGLSVEKCVIILKFVINLILKENINDEEKLNSITNIINNLIDASSQLIIIRKSLKGKSCYTIFSVGK
jgi:hypothetical protein